MGTDVLLPDLAEPHREPPGIGLRLTGGVRGAGIGRREPLRRVRERQED
ncbi:MAG: hypothetical protein JST11_14320 [Acidobacteria bacterium]|nr:hypothetical protein [Acidobacteriota bacterium]